MTFRPPLRHFERSLPVSVAVALIAEAGALLVWGGRTSERLDQLELRTSEHSTAVDRLTRLEVQMSSARVAIDRIEHKLDAAIEGLGKP